MYEEHPLMYKLNFGYSTSSGTPEKSGSRLRIPTRELGVSKEFPGFQHDTIFRTCFLILKGVSSSVREVKEYKVPEQKRFHLLSSIDERMIDERRSSEALEFKPSYIVDDGPFPETSGQKYVFDLGGPSHDPFGWFSWEVIAESVEIEGGEILKEFK